MYTQWKLNNCLLSEDMRDCLQNGWKAILLCHCLPSDTKLAFVSMEVKVPVYGLSLHASITIAL